MDGLSLSQWQEAGQQSQKETRKRTRDAERQKLPQLNPSFETPNSNALH